MEGLRRPVQSNGNGAVEQGRDGLTCETIPRSIGGACGGRRRFRGSELHRLRLGLPLYTQAHQGRHRPNG